MFSMTVLLYITLDDCETCVNVKAKVVVVVRGGAQFKLFCTGRQEMTVFILFLIHF